MMYKTSSGPKHELGNIQQVSHRAFDANFNFGLNPKVHLASSWIIIGSTVISHTHQLCILLSLVAIRRSFKDIKHFLFCVAIKGDG